ncbi:MAG: hypothetical protein M0R66_00400 [Candidatus Omnitrophica bacterium]|nr:hypothetical protein [Candidatus Omnitrophota bacterium]
MRYFLVQRLRGDYFRALFIHRAQQRDRLLGFMQLIANFIRGSRHARISRERRETSARSL